MTNISQETINKKNIPEEVLWVCEMLSKNNFDSYLVGGCVRDLFLSREPGDWDITTNATPDEIINIFGEDETVYENPFGTVGVKIRKNDSETEEVEIIEVTTYRKEGEYEDFRRPNKLEWGKTIEEDLERRDFTMNAIAYNPINDILKDIYKGQNDIKDKIIRTVGEAEERFNEDALRMLRAVRFSAQLNFVISNETLEAIFRLASNLEKISKERIRDEFIKIIMSSNPMQGLLISQKLGMLKYISSELESAVGIEQNGHHAFDVFEHSLRSLNHAASREFDLEIKLAALFHDIGKVKTRRFDETKKDYTFYGHEVVSERVTKKILEELKVEKKVIEKTCKLVRYHMFFSDPNEVKLSSVRRLIVNIGKENIWDLINLRLCDRMGSGTKKEEPWRLRKFESMIEEALRDPISLKTLKIDGEKIMTILNEKPGKKIGLILHALFEEVIDNASKNNLEYLEKRVLELNKLSEIELESLGTSGKDKMQNLNEEELVEIKKKFKV
ncbi:CCA-adding enzyme [bioreactor metagenome]|uniref:CCA-adding enzyme n=1 Tax=bioreactor metagenome TaxID=1076179 RepID=A0A644UAB4_9ZZZZ|nr:CCA tRNA nucleotidyltransferase [Candidatus Elulimicrobiales bacterium]